VNTDNVREILQGIYDDNGILTRKLVVEIAQDESHPLHHRFDWDDRTAGQSWRLEQAGQLIRTARVSYKEADEDSDERSVAAFHALPNPRGWVYEPAHVIAEDPFKRRMLLNAMRREWLAFKRRYERFEEFTEMVREAAA
jgi:hypothetical protein